MRDRPPAATLSLDLDNKWAYLKTNASAGWEEFPSYLDLVTPRMLAFLRKKGCTVTCFIVGQDAALEKNHAALRAITDAGHEAGNHSFGHEPWLHRYDAATIEDEIARTESHIAQVTGQRPLGFRGPGFSLSETTLRILAKRGYRYDATTFPNILNPLARFYFLRIASLSEEERESRKQLYGSWRDGLRPLTPYRWDLGDATLAEIPVTTMPLFKAPIHFTYLAYLQGRSTMLAKAYFHTALRLCTLTGTPLSMLLHPLDFLDADDVPELAFFPGMRTPHAEKMALLDDVITAMARHCELTTLGQLAERILGDDTAPSLTPDLPQ